MNSFHKIVLGTAQLGMPYGIANRTGQPDQTLATAIVRKAWENGIKEFDTAQAYGDSEFVLGTALARLGISKKARVITKLDPKLDHLNAETIFKSLDHSLRRLGNESLFGLMLHREEMLSIWDKGLAKILGSLVLSGKVERIGASIYSPDKAVEALNTDGIDMVQLPTNILDRRFENAGVFELAMKRKKQVYIRSVFLQGLILMDPSEIPTNMVFAKSVLENLDLISSGLGLTKQEVSLGYIKSEIKNANVILGTETPDQLEENITAWRKEMPKSLKSQIKTAFSSIDERILNPVFWPE